MKQYVGLIVEADLGEDFSSLEMYLELTYGLVVKMLPNFWSFDSDSDVVDILNGAEDFLLGHKGVCVRFEHMIALTNNMAKDYPN